MRAFFLVLILANLAFFAYARWLLGPDPAVLDLPRLQVTPEKIRIIHVGARASAPAQVANAAPARTVEACVAWGTLAGADVTRADAAIARLGLPQAALLRTVSDASGYWVYLPPLKTQAEITRRLAALKAHGVQDFYVVRDSTPWHNAISLGIFKSEDTARSVADRLRKQGITGVAMERRDNFLKQVVYFVRNPTDSTVARMARLQQEFPGTEVKAVPCPAVDDGTS